MVMWASSSIGGNSSQDQLNEPVTPAHKTPITSPIINNGVAAKTSRIGKSSAGNT